MTNDDDAADYAYDLSGLMWLAGFTWIEADAYLKATKYPKKDIRLFQAAFMSHHSFEEEIRQKCGFFGMGWDKRHA